MDAEWMADAVGIVVGMTDGVNLQIKTGTASLRFPVVFW
jgi:hypothetical protein